MRFLSRDDEMWLCWLAGWKNETRVSAGALRACLRANVRCIPPGQTAWMTFLGLFRCGFGGFGGVGALRWRGYRFLMARRVIFSSLYLTFSTFYHLCFFAFRASPGRAYDGLVASCIPVRCYIHFTALRACLPPLWGHQDAPSSSMLDAILYLPG